MTGTRMPHSPLQDPQSLAARLAARAPFKLDPSKTHGLPKASFNTAGLAQLTAQATAQSTFQAASGEPDLRYLLHHGTMGFSLADYYTYLPLGWNGWLDEQLNPASIDDSDVENTLAFLPSLGLTPSQLFLGYLDDQVEQVVIELQYAVLLRAIYSKRQLFERMVTFWTDHFNISQLDGLCLWTKTDDDREVIRKHALGNFPDMLKASARSSAMLWYLDAYANVVGAPQENYARELLELHTLGVDGPYTETDIKEIARCFTGWTLGGLGGTTDVGEFDFNPALHDTGQKIVLGVTIPAGGGIEDGERVLEILAHHPKTANFISRKMCRWLLMNDPPEKLVYMVSQVYMQTSGDIGSMIRTILDPDTVKRIPEADRTKFRQPLHFMIALMRAALITSTDLLQVTWASMRIGQTPYWWPSPDGPPDSIEKWGGGVMPRWEFASRLFAGEIAGNVFDPTVMHLLLAVAPEGTIGARINFALTGGRMDASDQAGVDSMFDAIPHLSNYVIGEGFALAASSPSYQFI